MVITTKLSISQTKKVTRNFFNWLTFKTLSNGRYGTRTDYHNSLNENPLRNSKNFSVTECVTLLDNPTLSPDDRQALIAVISAWPILTPEAKIEILKTIDAMRREPIGMGMRWELSTPTKEIQKKFKRYFPVKVEAGDRRGRLQIDYWVCKSNMKNER